MRCLHSRGVLILVLSRVLWYENVNNIRTILEAIAVMEDDYDKRMTKVETLKDYLGEERYQVLHPDKFNYLVDMNKGQIA